MKKIYSLLLAVSAFVSTVDAQITINQGGFEGAFTVNGAYPSYTTVNGWGSLALSSFKGTDNPIEGAQYLHQVNTKDPGMASLIGPTFGLNGTDIIPGYCTQSINLNNATGLEQFEISFYFKSKITTGAHPIMGIVFQVVDTIGTDKVTYAAVQEVTSSYADWEYASLFLEKLNDGENHVLQITITTNLGSVFQQTPLDLIEGDELSVDGIGIESLGIQVQATSSLFAYPNPTEGISTIVSSKPVSNIVVYGTDGKQLFTQTSKTLDLTQLPSGAYFYEVTTTDGEVVRQSVLKK